VRGSQSIQIAPPPDPLKILSTNTCYLLSLPNEMLISIIETVDVHDLPSLSRACSLLQQITAPIYLRRLGVLESRAFQYSVRLVGELPLDVVFLLASMTLITSCSLRLDLRYIIEHWQIIRRFLANTTNISYVTVLVHKEDRHLLLRGSTGKIAKALSSFLASLASKNCYDFSFERSPCDPVTPYTPSFPCIEPQKGRTEAVRIFASTIENLELHVDLFRTAPLVRVAQYFANGPSVTRLHLRASCPSSEADFGTILPCFQLPSLQDVTISGSVRIVHLLPFLVRHPNVEILDLSCMRPACWSFLHEPLTSDKALLTSLTTLTASVGCIIELFNAFSMPRLSSVKMSVWSSSDMLLLKGALNAMSAHTALYGSPNVRLEIAVFTGQDFMSRFRSPTLPFVVDDAIYPEPGLLGISELEVWFQDGVKSEESMVSIVLYNMTVI
jgi:hypothetical protein